MIVCGSMSLTQTLAFPRQQLISTNVLINFEIVDVSEELTVPPIVAEHSARVARQLRLADEDGLPGRATKARVSVAERRRAKVAMGAE